MKDFTCKFCKKKLAEFEIKDGLLKIKCAKCGTLNEVEIEKSEPLRRPVLKK